MCRRPASAIHRQRQADHHLDRAALDDERRDPAQILATGGSVGTAPHGLDRRRKYRVWIARRDSDTDAADVNPEPNSWAKLPNLRSVGAGHDGSRLAHALATRC
jgi:hypothetical protein